MVDRESVAARLDLLARLLAELEPTRAHGLDAYLADELLRAATERRLQLAEQVCIDIAAHLLSELNAPTASDYAGVFKALADAGHLDRELAGRLIQAAKQRNLLVHAYLEIDDRMVFESSSTSTTSVRSRPQYNGSWRTRSSRTPSSRQIKWYRLGMRATIDKAGRLVIPKQLRDRVGLRPGGVEVTAEGTGLRVEPLAAESVEARDGRLVIPSGGAQIDDDLVRWLRDAGQR